MCTGALYKGGKDSYKSFELLEFQKTSMRSRHVSLTTILPLNTQPAYLDVAYMHENFLIYRFICKSRATISESIKAVFFNVSLQSIL